MCVLTSPEIRERISVPSLVRRGQTAACGRQGWFRIRQHCEGLPVKRSKATPGLKYSLELFQAKA